MNKVNAVILSILVIGAFITKVIIDQMVYVWSRPDMIVAAYSFLVSTTLCVKLKMFRHYRFYSRRGDFGDFMILTTFIIWYYIYVIFSQFFGVNYIWYELNGFLINIFMIGCIIVYFAIDQEIKLQARKSKSKKRKRKRRNKKKKIQKVKEETPNYSSKYKPRKRD